MRFLVLLLALAASGCAPSIAPIYRDYRIPPEAQATPEASGEMTTGEIDPELEARLLAALEEAGWSVAASDVSTVLSTDVRPISTGAFSRVEASLDLAPLNGRFVRVYVHAVRRNVLGGRSKLPYLSRGLRERALAEITASLAARGLAALDAPRERDEEATD